MSVNDAITGLRWRKASRSTGSGEDCVEIAQLGDLIAVRDSKDPEGPRLLIRHTAWEEVARAVVDGELDI